MSGIPVHDRRNERREATKAEILDAAWALAREQGLTGFSLRDLGARVGMRAQSLYSYFPSKHALFDAMFAAGNRALLARLEQLAPPSEPAEMLAQGARLFMDFCLEEPVRSQLLFQRTVPGFEPSPESYAAAVEVLEGAGQRIRNAGVDDPRAVDLWTALTSGLINQQLANDPGGNRWSRLIDDAVDMFLGHLKRRAQ